MDALDSTSDRPGITHPILALPNEILSEIFIQTLPHYPVCPPILGFDSPTNLMQVCRSWMEVAATTPALWRAIALCTDPGLSPYSKLQLATARTWMLRSGALRLCLVFSTVMAGDDGDDIRVVRDALDLFASERHRWEYLALSIPVSFWIPRHFMERDLPLLRELEIIFLDLPDKPYADVGRLNAPNLRTVFLDCDFQVHSGLLCPRLINWSQLSSIYLLNVDLQTAVAVLSAAANLWACRLAFERRFGTVNGPLSPRLVLVLPLLETLIVSAEFSACEDLDNLLLALRAPRLRYLSLDEDMLLHQAETWRLLPKSMGCRLEHLVINAHTESL
uniref:F-box domain-containing protein n=1 Tax=Mycena chlorophos TaxID=658473 RepID=A0ABQ0KWP3_MYCCL|nr:predicted protein [Mycena chlorophos]